MQRRKVESMTTKKRRLRQVEVELPTRAPVKPEDITDSIIAITTLGRFNMMLAFDAIELEKEGRKAEWREEHRVAWARWQAALDMVEPEAENMKILRAQEEVDDVPCGIYMHARFEEVLRTGSHDEPISSPRFQRILGQLRRKYAGQRAIAAVRLGYIRPRQKWSVAR